jgi:pyruvate dehydrogenase E2 component (dihydrolipoyllysine-residue acetyltransferase)
MEEGKILKWLKRVGDAIEAGEVIAEVETDKADMELEATESGVLRAIQVAEGENAAVGTVIALVEGNGSGRAATTPMSPSKAAAGPSTVEPNPESVAQDAGKTRAEPGLSAAKKPTAPMRPAANRERHVPKASAAARTLADEHGIELAAVTGSGPDGRIVSEDVEAAFAESTQRTSARRDVRMHEAPVTERHELSRMRQSIARRMSEAFRDIPHFSVTAEIDMSEAVRLKAALEKDQTFDVPVTYTHMVLKAVARALTRHPRLNASYRDGALEVHGEVNLGMAVSVEDGLIVPVLPRADERSLAEIATEARRLVAQTKQGRFAREDLSGGTFTVSNMGILDIEAFTAVINPPQAAILAVGSIKPRAIVRDGVVVAAHTMFVTVSCDHRIIDGVMAGRFLEELKTLLENPIGLVVS